MVWIFGLLSILLVGCGGNLAEPHAVLERQILRPQTFSDNRRSVTDFGANLNDSQPDDDALSQCLRFAIDKSAICRIPRGTLTLTRYPAELRGPAGKKNLDLNGGVLEGGGLRTKIEGISEKGFDVLNLERVKNFTIRNLTITAKKTTSDPKQGVNGISLTNGTSQILVEMVTVRDLPYVNKGTHFDGGKAFTVQPGATPNESSSDIVFRFCRSESNPVGFGVDINPNASTTPGSIEMAFNQVSDAALGFGISSSEKIGGGTASGVVIRIHDNNVLGTHRPLVIGRGSGLRVENNVFDSSNVENNFFPDIFLYAGYPVVLVGVSDFTFSRNTLSNSEQNLAAALLGGATGRANLENGEVSMNNFRSRTKKGIAYFSAVGADVTNVKFQNNFYSSEITEPLDPNFNRPPQ